MGFGMGRVDAGEMEGEGGNILADARMPLERGMCKRTIPSLQRKRGCEMCEDGPPVLSS